VCSLQARTGYCYIRECEDRAKDMHLFYEKNEEVLNSRVTADDT
jgi:hypothetical protein